MKRASIVFATLLLCLSFLMNTALALDEQKTERIDYEDGSYAIITTIPAGMTRSRCADTLEYTYYNASDQKCFSYTLYATFTYDGVTATADSAAGRADLYLQGWSLTSHNEYTSGNTAYGNATFSSPLGLKHPVNLSLTCDKNGNVT